MDDELCNQANEESRLAGGEPHLSAWNGYEPRDVSERVSGLGGMEPVALKDLPFGDYER